MKLSRLKVTRSCLVLAVTLMSGAAALADAPSQPPTPVAAKTETVVLGAGVSMEFVLIPAGVFQMGSPEEVGDEDETPRHQVTLTRPFYLGKYEVTQEQWVQLMGSNPSHFKGAKQPVDTVSWKDCQRFLEKLQEKTGRVFTLPTEAQWEYACRAGTGTRWHFGDESALAGEYAWFEKNSGGVTHPVGGKKPNPWGIHDLHGNLGEWCADWYTSPYPKTGVTDPRGSPTGESRIVRGGAWGDDPANLRSAYRNANGPDGAHNGIGFRCVMAVQAPPQK